MAVEISSLLAGLGEQTLEREGHELERAVAGAEDDADTGVDDAHAKVACLFGGGFPVDAQASQKIAAGRGGFVDALG